jgi:hypothetical protein
MNTLAALVRQAEERLFRASENCFVELLDRAPTIFTGEFFAPNDLTEWAARLVKDRP